LDVGDAQVVEGGDGASFLQEAGAEFVVVGEMGVHDLDHDVATQAQVMGPVDGAHAAFAQQFVNAIGSVQRLAEEFFHRRTPLWPRSGMGQRWLFCCQCLSVVQGCSVLKKQGLNTSFLDRINKISRIFSCFYPVHPVNPVHLSALCRELNSPGRWYV